MIADNEITIKKGELPDDKLFMESLLTLRVVVNAKELNGNIENTITEKIKKMVENKCIKEGFVLPDSVVLQEHSSPLIDRGNFIFYAKYLCRICYPVEGMILECVCYNKSKAGIRAIYEYTTEMNETIQPIVVFICRDQYNKTSIDDNIERIDRIREKDRIKVCIIGVRFEINSNMINAIAKLA